MRGHLGRGEDDSYLASVSDLMVGLLFVFIIMLMAFALDMRKAQRDAVDDETEAVKVEDRATQALERLARDRDRLEHERDELQRQRDSVNELAQRLLRQEQARASLLDGLAAELSRLAVPVSVDAGNGVLRLPESLLFEPGAATLRPEGEAALARLAHVLERALGCDDAAGCAGGHGAALEAILVEGHTDATPIHSAAFVDNWALSVTRGVNTYKALARSAPTLDRLRNGRGHALLGVAGYEARRPAAAGDSPQDHRQNRRIDLRFITAAPGAETLE